MKTGDDEKSRKVELISRPSSNLRPPSYRGSISGSEDGLNPGSEANDAGPDLQNVHWLSRGAMGTSSRRLSLKEALKLDYNPLPPAEEDDDRWIETTKVPKVIKNMVKALPDVSEVEGKYRRKAFFFWVVLFMGFMCYLVYAVRSGLEARKNPPTRITTSAHNTWHLPNMVLCDDRMLSVDRALHSGWSAGYGPSDDDKTHFRSMVKVLDDECAIRTGCFWLNFEQLQPVDITAPITRKMVAMDIIYFPKKWDPILYVDTLPNVYAAHLIFTDDSPEEWCASSPKRAFSNIFPIPVSQLNDNTQRVYAFMTRQDVTELVTDENGMDTKAENLVQYQLNAESIPVTNGLSMINGFKWFVPCNFTDGHMAGDSSLCQGELDETITYAGTNNASAQAILLTFIQNELVVTYQEVDPFSIPTLLGNIGGFWSYTGGVFALVYVMSESGKRRPHSLFRGKKWRRFFRRMRRKADRAIGYVIGDRDRGRSRSQMSFDSKGPSQGGGGGENDPEAPPLSNRVQFNDSSEMDEEERQREDRLRQQSMEKRVVKLEAILKSIVSAKLLLDPQALMDDGLDPSAGGDTHLTIEDAMAAHTRAEREQEERERCGTDETVHSTSGSGGGGGGVEEEVCVKLSVSQPPTPTGHRDELERQKEDVKRGRPSEL